MCHNIQGRKEDGIFIITEDLRECKVHIQLIKLVITVTTLT